ncbi:MAG: NADH-quinone oxidoreductase subunit C, partial [Acidobacteriales bacterium]|nr:NADH-quinone oxidoreductase subunit C [Terriglobales bacterium]
MESLDSLAHRSQDAVPGAHVAIVPNDSPSAQTSLLIDSTHALAVARFLRDDPQLQFDYASNVTGIDWLDSATKVKTKVKKIVDGVEKEVEEMT